MPRKTHAHKYILRPTSNQPVWACAYPDCGHFMPAHLTNLVEGRFSVCWSCEAKFVLTADSMKESQPRCDDCRLGIKQDEVEKFFHLSPNVPPVE